MASAEVREELRCSLCLDIYSDPICLSCGHHFCRNCIDNVFEQQKESRVYTCPECRTVFKKKPELIRSLKLCNIVEHFVSDKTKPDGIIVCTYCIGFNTRAVIRCLLCEAFLCEEHLKVHSKSQEHVLTDTKSNVLLDSDRKCPTHMELLKYYCYQDDVCICASCYIIGNHNGHQVDSLEDSYNKKTRELEKVLNEISSTRKNIDVQIQQLEEQDKQVQENAAAIKDRITNLFFDIRKQINDLENKVLREINKQQVQAVKHISDKIQHMEIQKEELTQKILQMEKLFAANDAVIFLKECKYILSDFADSKNCTKKEHKSNDTAVHKLDNVLISVTLQNSLGNLFDLLPILKAERGFYLEAGSDILLDASTANDMIVLSNDLKTASHLNRDVKYSPVPQKFTFCQILGTTSFNSGEHYVEIQVSTSGYWVVGMAYPTINKTGNDSLIGCNEKSWGLAMLNNNLSALHNSERKSICIDSPLQAIGIYLNYKNGQLSFYQLSSPIRHLHTFSANFTEPLYPAFYICGDSWVRVKS